MAVLNPSVDPDGPFSPPRLRMRVCHLRTETLRLPGVRTWSRALWLAKPFPEARHESDVFGIPVTPGGLVDGTIPGRLGDQGEGVQPWEDPDLMAVDLVVPTPEVLRLGGGEAIARLESCVVGPRSSGPLGQFLGIAFEVRVNPFKFPTEVRILPGADQGQGVAQFLLYGCHHEPAETGWVTGRPFHVRGWRSLPFGKLEGCCQRVVSFASGQRERDPVERPMLFDGLYLAPNKCKQGEVMRSGETGVQPPRALVWPLCPPQLFGDVGARRLTTGSIGKDGALEDQPVGYQRFGQPERQRAAREDVAGGVSRSGAIRSGEAKLSLNQAAIRVPELSCRAFGDQLETVEPSAVADGTEMFQCFLVKVRQRSGFVAEPCQFHITRRDEVGGIRFGGRTGFLASEGFVIFREEGFIQVLHLLVGVASAREILPQALQCLADTPVAFPPAT